ncbi:transcriptional repressor [Lachnospiraceae bacterium NSJ-143]|nr:transcriptional repressor [Lachnospiraceae bacterium NSJ-143]
MKQFAEILKEKGLKVTPQRLAVYSALINTKSHPSAEAIHKMLIADNPSISLATVYKTLDSFKSAGLIKELNFCFEHSNYDADMSDHQHIVCTKCCHVFDVYYKPDSSMRETVEKQSGFKINDEQIVFYGICQDCASKS